MLNLILAGAAALAAPGAVASVPDILPLARRAEVEDRWLKDRLDSVVPMLMRREGVDMWVLIASEYNEDPVVKTMLPATWLSARRRTVLIFHDRGAERGVERIAVTRYPVGDFAASWDPEAEPDQWKRIAAIVAERDPKRIAINLSETFALANGLSHTEHEALRAAIGDTYASRLMSNPRLAIGWLETRVPSEMAAYPAIARVAQTIIDEGLSEVAILPGVTTTDDLVWWFRSRVAGLGLASWFHPSVNVQRPERGTFGIATMGVATGTVIQPGDLIHLDFGIHYLGLATDMQRMAYVLRPGETEAPKGLRDGMAQLGKAVDATTASLRTGRTGNDILAAALKRTRAERVNATIYTHPIGDHGHGAGPAIGFWDDQTGGPRGDLPIHANTMWSIELNAQHPVAEWGGQTVRFMFEENGFFDGERFRFIADRQREMILIPGG